MKLLAITLYVLNYIRCAIGCIYNYIKYSRKFSVWGLSDIPLLFIPRHDRYFLDQDYPYYSINLTNAYSTARRLSMTDPTGYFLKCILLDNKKHFSTVVLEELLELAVYNNKINNIKEILDIRNIKFNLKMEQSIYPAMKYVIQHNIKMLEIDNKFKEEEII